MEDDQKRTKTVAFRPYKENMHVPNELNTLSEAEILAIAARLAQRHEELMRTDARYQELYNSLPDRSGYSSGLPATVAVMDGLEKAWKTVAKTEQHDRWRLEHNYRKDHQRRRARAVQRLLEQGEIEEAQRVAAGAKWRAVWLKKR